MRKSFILSALIFLFIAGISAQEQEGYYESAEGKSEAALKTALYNIIKGHYNVGYDGLYNIYPTSDNTDNNKVWDMYSTCTWTHGQKKCGNYSTVCDCYNREHSIPQSWFSERAPMKSDAFHVYPTDGKVNGQRSNDPFGECANGTTLTNGKGRSGSSTFPGYSGKVFEPDDEYKGDFARTYFYFATRYQDIMTSIGGASFNKTAYPSFSTWSLNLFLKWHRDDPVSEKEIVRNNAVEAFQRNRNPFIDHPELAEFIWGNRKGEPWSLTSGVDDFILEFFIAENPVQNTITIRTDESLMNYSIFDLSGKMIQFGEVVSNGNIEVSGLQNGLYLLQLQVGSKTAVQKVIINR